MTSYAGRSFSEAAEFLANDNYKVIKRIAKETYLFWIGKDSIVIAYNGYVIIEYNRDGSVVLLADTGLSEKVRNRLNQWAPVGINGEWSIVYMLEIGPAMGRAKNYVYGDKRVPIPYSYGMKIEPERIGYTR